MDKIKGKIKNKPEDKLKGMIRKNVPEYDRSKSDKIIPDEYDFSQIVDGDTVFCDNKDIALAVCKQFELFKKRKSNKGKWKHVVKDHKNGTYSIQIYDDPAHIAKVEENHKKWLKQMDGSY